MRDNLVPSEDSIDHSTHYLRTLTTMAQRRKVTAQEAIFSANGIKLVDKGARIDSRMHDRLVQHKLREPVDMHLSVEDAVTSAFLRQQADHLLLHADLPRLLAQSLGGTARLSAPLKTLSLTPRIAFRLTVMREELPELFTHSLQVMLTAQYLALASRMADIWWPTRSRPCCWCAMPAFTAPASKRPSWSTTNAWMARAIHADCPATIFRPWGRCC